jgi:hypothetical protein
MKITTPVAGYRCPLVMALIESGMVPAACTRVIIDIPINGAVAIYCDYFADERINNPAVLDAVRDLGVKIKTKRKKRVAAIPDRSNRAR